jgi:hypothetical protein
MSNENKKSYHCNIDRGFIGSTGVGESTEDTPRAGRQAGVRVHAVKHGMMGLAWARQYGSNAAWKNGRTY